jgi:HK97 family phage major capsid protein
MTQGVAADGGYAVPKVISSQIEELLNVISPIRKIATVRQTTTQDFNQLMNIRGTAGGWVGETAARPATSTPQFANIKPTMGDLYANPMASQWMVDDVGFDLGAWLAQQVADEFDRAEGAEFVGGTGGAGPTGFLNGTPVSTDDATRAFGTLQYIPTGVAGGWPASNPVDLLLSVIFKVKAGYRQNASWVMPKAILSELAVFKDSSGRYVLSPLATPTVPQTLFGFPVVEAESMPARAANSLSIAFGDFRRGYLIAERHGIRVIRDELTSKPYIGLYCTRRVGGCVMNSEAIKLVKYSVT